MATKHDQRRCMVCRDYAVHEKAQRGPGDWPAKLGTIHLAHSLNAKKSFCGRPLRTGLLWSIRPGIFTCKACRRAAAL